MKLDLVKSNLGSGQDLYFCKFIVRRIQNSSFNAQQIFKVVIVIVSCQGYLYLKVTGFNTGMPEAREEMPSITTLESSQTWGLGFECKPSHQIILKKSALDSFHTNLCGILKLFRSSINTKASLFHLQTLNHHL